MKILRKFLNKLTTNNILDEIKMQTAINIEPNRKNGKKILLLNDCEDLCHWGCYGTNYALKEQLFNQGITEIVSVGNRVTHKIKHIPKSVEEFGDNKRFLKIYPELSRHIQMSDGVVINGEGTIHHFHNAPRALLYLAFVSKHFFNKAVFLINHSCYPCTEEKNVIDFYKAGYQSCDYIAAREKQSVSVIENILGVKCVLAFDSLPLTINKMQPLIKILPLSLSSPYICISGAANYQEKNSSIIAQALLKHFPNHQYIYLCGSKTQENRYEEINVFNSLKKHLPQIHLFEAQTFIDWLSIIKSSDVLLSGRFHYTIAALSLGVKTIYFTSNTLKIDSIAKDFNLQEAIPIKPNSKVESLLNSQLDFIKNQPCKNFLDDFCALALRNYEWNISN